MEEVTKIESTSDESFVEATLSKEESAAQKFASMVGPFKSMVKNAKSKGSLVRVINALIEFPLGSSKPRFLNKHEEMLFWLFQEISTVKSEVVDHLMKQINNEKQGENNNVENSQ